MPLFRIDALGLAFVTIAVLGSHPFAVAADHAAPALGPTPGWVKLSAFNGLEPGTIAVDRTTGDLYALPWGGGLWRSADRGTSFTRIDPGVFVAGGAENGDNLELNPDGKGMACFIIYGSSGITMDGGKSWEVFGASHMDFGVVDWTDPEANTIMASKHESGGTLVLSRDRGKSWKTIATGSTSIGIIDAKTLIMGCSAGIKRSSDDGVTWTVVSPLVPTCTSMRVFKGKAYFLTGSGLAVSADKGLTWTIQGNPVRGHCALMFGRDESQLCVVDRPFDGFWQSNDAGSTWEKVIDSPPPTFNDGYTAGTWYRTYAFDPVNQVYYANGRGIPAYRYQRAPAVSDVAMADRLLADIAKVADPKSSAFFKARVKLYAVTASMYLDRAQRQKVDEWVGDVKEDAMNHQAAVRSELAQDPIRKDFKKFLAAQAKPYAGTVLDAWFNDAGTLVAVKSAVAAFEKKATDTMTRDERKGFVGQVEAARQKVTTREFQGLIDGLAERARKKAAL